jgi:hypothetical protein
MTPAATKSVTATSGFAERYKKSLPRAQAEKALEQLGEAEANPARLNSAAYLICNDAAAE